MLTAKAIARQQYNQCVITNKPTKRSDKIVRTIANPMKSMGDREVDGSRAIAQTLKLRGDRSQPHNLCVIQDRATGYIANLFPRLDVSLWMERIFCCQSSV
jgi:hypothetical protein